LRRRWQPYRIRTGCHWPPDPRPLDDACSRETIRGCNIIMCGGDAIAVCCGDSTVVAGNPVVTGPLARQCRMTDSPLLPGADALPTLEAERIALRMLRPDDAADVYAIFSDPRVMRYWSSPPMTDPAQAAGYIEQIHAWFERRGGMQWGIVERGEDRVIGTTTLCAFSLEHRRCEIGYALAADRWHRGLATEALAAALDFAFGTLPFERVEADIDPRNEPSIRLVERMGFRREGVLRSRWCIGGEMQDSALYGLLRSDRATAT
jgi:ribosomal-protein-alanine N-acetyltransferase